MAGGGGRPGIDLIGGGRRGRSFTLDGRGGRGGSEEFGFVVLAVSGLVWTTGPFLKAGAGAGLGGLAGAGPEVLGAAAGLAGSGFGSRGVDETPEGLGARFGALALRGAISAAGLFGTPGRELPTFTLWFVALCVASLPVWVSVCDPPLTSTKGLGVRVGVVHPSVVLLSGCETPTLTLGVTGGLGGGLGSLRQGVSLGGGGRGAGTGAEERVSVLDWGLGVIVGFSVGLMGCGSRPGADFSDGSAVV